MTILTIMEKGSQRLVASIAWMQMVEWNDIVRSSPMSLDTTRPYPLIMILALLAGLDDTLR